MPFNYTFRADDISTWDVDTRDLVENRDRELELYSTTIDNSFLNLNASNLTSGTVPTGRMSGSYAGITGLGTLGSLTVTGDLTVDTNTLRVDSTNNRVGINVTSPTSNLDIVGNQVIRAAATQDGIQLAGRAGGTGSLTTKLIPTTLTTNRTLTLPNVDGTLITTGNLSSITSVGTLTELLVGDVCTTTTVAAANDTGSFSVRGDGTFPAVMSFHRTGAYAVNFGLSTANKMELGGWSASTIKFTWDMPTGNYNAVGTISSAGLTTSTNLTLSASTNAVIFTANTPDTALPWSQGPVLQGQTGWAFYSAVLGSYRMGFRSGSSGVTRYMWCADNVLIGQQPDDGQMTTTFNVIGNMRTTTGYYGSVTFGSYGSLTIRGTNNGYAGIANPDTSSTVMWQNGVYGAIFGHYKNDNAWNFYVGNGTFTPSDARYKRDIEPLQHGMNFIREIVPVTYDPLTEDPNDDPETTFGRTHYGFTTQNILQALTNAGETRDVALVDIGGPDSASAMNSDRQYLNHSGLIAPMVKAIQELDARLQQLETV